jgi:hypothetical protein
LNLSLSWDAEAELEVGRAASKRQPQGASNFRDSARRALADANDHWHMAEHRIPGVNFSLRVSWRLSPWARPRGKLVGIRDPFRHGADARCRSRRGVQLHGVKPAGTRLRLRHTVVLSRSTARSLSNRLDLVRRSGCQPSKVIQGLGPLTVLRARPPAHDVPELTIERSCCAAPSCDVVPERSATALGRSAPPMAGSAVLVLHPRVP